VISALRGPQISDSRVSCLTVRREMSLPAGIGRDEEEHLFEEVNPDLENG
jgi:hypothetical protein